MWVMSLALLFPFSFAAETVGLSQDGERYAIKLFRPAKPGDRMEVKKTAFERSEVTGKVDGAVTKEQASEWKIECEFLEEILETNEQGEATQRSVLLKSCKQTENGRRTAEITFDKPILIQSYTDRDPEFSADGRRLNRSLQRVMSRMYSDLVGGPIDDDFYGTNSEVRVGEKWHINRQAYAKARQTSDGVSNKNVDGYGQVKRVMGEGAEKCYEVQIDVTYEPAVHPLSEGFEVTSCKQSIRIIRQCPIDPDRVLPVSKIIREGWTINRALGPNDGPVIVVVHYGRGELTVERKAVLEDGDRKKDMPQGEDGI